MKLKVNDEVRVIGTANTVAQHGYFPDYMANVGDIKKVAKCWSVDEGVQLDDGFIYAVDDLSLVNRKHK